MLERSEMVDIYIIENCNGLIHVGIFSIFPKIQKEQKFQEFKKNFMSDGYKEDCHLEKTEMNEEEECTSIENAFRAIFDADLNDQTNSAILFQEIEKSVLVYSQQQEITISEDQFTFLLDQINSDNVLYQVLCTRIIQHLLSSEKYRKTFLFDLFFDIFQHIGEPKYFPYYDEIACSLISIFGFFVNSTNSFQIHHCFSNDFFTFLQSVLFQFQEISDETLHPMIHLSACEFMVHAIDNYDLLFENSNVFDFLGFLFHEMNEQNCNYLSECVEILISYEYYQKEWQKTMDLLLQCLSFNDVTKNRVYKALLQVNDSNFLFRLCENEMFFHTFIDTLEPGDEKNEESPHVLIVFKILSHMFVLNPKKCTDLFFNLNHENIIQRIMFFIQYGSYDIKISASLFVFQVMTKFPETFHQILDDFDFFPDLLDGILSSFSSSSPSKYNEQFRYHFYNSILSMYTYLQTQSLGDNFTDLLMEHDFFGLVSEEEETNEELIFLHKALFEYAPNESEE